MIFKETILKGVFVIEIEPIEDARGYFATSYTMEEFAKHGIDLTIVQTNMSFNKKCGTLRGMHFQNPPHPQAKLLSCIQGSIYDVIIDLRPGSPTYRRWISMELAANGPARPTDKYKMIYVPVGFAHGFQTLEDNTVVVYQMSDYYHPECEGGVCHDDKAFNIPWPVEGKIFSPKDTKYPEFK